MNIFRNVGVAVSAVAMFGLSLQAFAAEIDISREVSNGSALISVDTDKFAIEFGAGTFDSSAIMRVRSLTEFQGKLPDGYKATELTPYRIEFSKKDGSSVDSISGSGIMLKFNGISGVKQPSIAFLPTASGSVLKIIKGVDQAGTLIFNATGSVNGDYMIIDSLVQNSGSTEKDAIDLSGLGDIGAKNSITDSVKTTSGTTSSNSGSYADIGSGSSKNEIIGGKGVSEVTIGDRVTGSENTFFYIMLLSILSISFIAGYRMIKV